MTTIHLFPCLIIALLQLICKDKRHHLSTITLKHHQSFTQIDRSIAIHMTISLYTIVIRIMYLNILLIWIIHILVIILWLDITDLMSILQSLHNMMIMIIHRSIIMVNVLSYPFIMTIMTKKE